MSYRIKEIRIKKGYSQEELSSKANVSRGIISALESGREVTTTTETLTKIARALDSKISDIFSD